MIQSGIDLFRGEAFLPFLLLRVLKNGKKVFFVLLIDVFLADLGVQIHIFPDQAVIGGFFIAAAFLIILHILQDVFCTDILIVCIVIMIVQHFLVAFAVIINQGFQRSSAFPLICDGQIDILALLCQSALQQINVLRLRTGKDLRIQARYLVIV